MLNKEETIIASDVNIDLLAINIDEDKKTQYQKAQARLLEVFTENLLNKGVVLMNNKPTFKRSEYESQLDCILTNKPDKLTDIKQFDSVSDHQVIFATRKMKITRTEEKLIITRNWNKINEENINNDILNHTLYKQTLLEKSSNKISENIVQIMNDVYDSYAPLNKRKIKAKENLTNDPIVKEAIKNRDNAYKTMKHLKTHEAEINFKNIKTNTRILIKKSNKKREEDEYTKHERSNKQIWKIAKRKLFKEEDSPMDRIQYNNELHVGSKASAQAINNYFKQKISQKSRNQK